MLDKKKIQNAKHIVIVLQKNASVDYLCSATALYTYLLQLHKKVSLYSERQDYALNLNFLPWFDKLKSSYPSSSDYSIQACSSLALYEYFASNDIILNLKVSTSLYAGLLDVTQGFTKGLNGTIFAMAKVLIENKADVQTSTRNLLHYQSLASLRLKAILLTKMKLEDNATKAVFDLSDEDLQQSGAKKLDALLVLQDALGLPTVKVAVILYNNKEIMKEERT